jgi:hypothetical protein
VHEEFRIGVCTEHGIAWRVESAYYSHFGIVRSCDLGGFHGRL